MCMPATLAEMRLMCQRLRLQLQRPQLRMPTTRCVGGRDMRVLPPQATLKLMLAEAICLSVQSWPCTVLLVCMCKACYVQDG